MKDRKGTELKVGDRCLRFNADGIKLSNQVVITELDEESGVVRGEGLKNLQQVVTVPDRLQKVGARVGGRAKNQPKKVVQYERDRAVAAEASAMAKKRRKGARR